MNLATGHQQGESFARTGTKLKPAIIIAEGCRGPGIIVNLRQIILTADRNS